MSISERMTIAADLESTYKEHAYGQCFTVDGIVKMGVFYNDDMENLYSRFVLVIGDIYIPPNGKKYRVVDFIRTEKFWKYKGCEVTDEKSV